MRRLPLEVGAWRDEPHPHLDIVTPVHIDYAAYRAAGGYELAASCVAGGRSREDVIAAMQASGLRGLGGAGFPAGRKWQIVAAEPAARLMAVNIDEGEPGTFKDRYYLERDPHRFLEGALIAAWAVGINDIYVYLRDEYHGCRAILERELSSSENERTALGKPRREVIFEKHRARIEALYSRL